MDAPSTASDRTREWRVVVPVKDARIGKSRLVATVSEADEQLRRAIAEDTVAAVVEALGPEGTIVVTSDPVLGPRWSAQGVAVCADPGQGLNAAIAAGLERAGEDWCRTAALLGDLPALTPGDLLDALSAAALHPQAFVPDRQSTGTVLRCGRAFTPRFGRASAAAHEADGAVRLPLDLPRLRTDVDDRESLLLAVALRVGPNTESALRRLGLG
jgi:2-phospho-L-lactate guanylyltransferase